MNSQPWALFVGFAITACSSPGFCEADLTVVEVAWTSSVVNRQPTDRVQPESRPRPLYFWTRLRGGAATLETLRREGKLPIVHQWVRSTILGQEGEELDPAQDDGKDLGVGSIRGSAGLTATVNDFGSFRWRTWSNKESVTAGTWTVTVRYANGDPVLCSGEPCQWSITLR